MPFGFSVGEIAFTAFVVALIYLSGLLPRLVARLERRSNGGESPSQPRGEPGERGEGE